MPRKSRFGHPVFHLKTTDTTMRDATEWAERNAPEGTLITADEQTAGRGRLGRSWVSEPEVGVYFSLILRPPVPASRAPILTLAIGLGVSRGVGEAAGLQCDLRWPNDVLLNGKKCSGILVESNADADRLRYAIVGVGINVNNASLPEEVAATATSLRIETGCEYLRETVLDTVLRHIERYYEMFLERGAPAVIEAFTRASSYVRGRKVVVESAGLHVVGTTAGLDPSGILLLEQPGGRIEPIVAGSVRPWTGDSENPH